MRMTARVLALALLSLAVSALPAMAGNGGKGGVRRKVLGVVAQADRARIDNATAQTGADIYSCDSLDTDEGGTMRVRVGGGQAYLTGLSQAELEDEGNEIQVLFSRGGVGFASPASGGLAVRTPAGIIRAANAQAAAGEVNMTGPTEMVISAMKGDLLLDNAGELRTIPEGKSARVTFEAGSAPGCRDEEPANANNSPKPPLLQHKIGFYLIVGAAAFLPSYFIWRAASESNSTPPNP